ncbi:hypothetical protein KFZ70_16330 [Tamlana fucoidanivorans]|uniref:Tetratricopeptide repeat protein n=1 Tax=Allotamlana fucoidanivorans TaxID=2583814 RepID=A0A5C4SH21_9FLAO|nr:hypothetical protein [Tamlana fucoidanivorans]TNJ42891.1 hypothetical protein FGF67_12950 [Tamlana fucoidanivorans]
MRSIFIFLAALVLFTACKKPEKKPVELVVTKTSSSKYKCAPPVTDAKWYTADNVAPLLDGYDVVNYPITTSNELVQRYFNQGLALAYAFNHAEAARSFYYATKLEPDCAMAYFGFAYVLGPNYNAGMEPDNYERAYEAIQKAKSLSKYASKKEQAFIEVMAKRYAPVPPEDRMPLDITYSNALKKLSAKYPEDAEIKTFYVESLMNLHPWDLFDKSGQPKPWAPEIVSTLEDIIKHNPKHPGAHHFYIHAVEMSNTPERANTSAQLFDDGLVSGSGHLLHMPSHTYIRTGEYHKGTLSNIAAVKADSTYVSACHAQGAYPLGYYPHNYHFLAATATLEGNSYWAMIGAQKVSNHVHPDIMKEPGWGTLQHYYSIPYYVAIKFKMWDAILNMKLESYNLPYPKAIRHYAEGMAYLGKGNIEQAKAELNALNTLKNNAQLKEITIWEINNVADLVNIAYNVLNAEIMAHECNLTDSIKTLKETVAMEDALNYNEPPDWFFSIRHHLGEVQIQAKQYEDAIKTYKKDLFYFPKNGWAHHGLKKAYTAINDQENLEQINKELLKSWAFADFDIL